MSNDLYTLDDLRYNRPPSIHEDDGKDKPIITILKSKPPAWIYDPAISRLYEIF